MWGTCRLLPLVELHVGPLRRTLIPCTSVQCAPGASPGANLTADVSPSFTAHTGSLSGRFEIEIGIIVSQEERWTFFRKYWCPCELKHQKVRELNTNTCLLLNTACKLLPLDILFCSLALCEVLHLMHQIHSSTESTVCWPSLWRWWCSLCKMKACSDTIWGPKPLWKKNRMCLNNK